VYLFGVIMDGNSPSPSPTQSGTVDEDPLGFILEVDGASAPLPCKVVRGFQDAVAAASDPRKPMPSRLVIVNPDVTTFDWLAAWSEDDVQVRRTLRIRRRLDGTAVVAVVTLAAFGRATPIALIVESLTLPSQGRRIVRSGVHPKSFLATIRARYKRSLQEPTANDVRTPSTDPSGGDIG
jgi:hypothetical protein